MVKFRFGTSGPGPNVYSSQPVWSYSKRKPAFTVSRLTVQRSWTNAAISARTPPRIPSYWFWRSVIWFGMPLSMRML